MERRHSAMNCNQALKFLKGLVWVLCMATTIAWSQEPVVDRPFRVKRFVQPDFPMKAKRDWINGCVIAEFFVNSEGRAERVSFIKVLPQGYFEKSVLAALSQMEFELLPSANPSTAMKTRQAFVFALEDSYTGAECKIEGAK
jgi:outer membrane biosynthesis protein TonB